MADALQNVGRVFQSLLRPGELTIIAAPVPPPNAPQIGEDKTLGRAKAREGAAKPAPTGSNLDPLAAAGLVISPAFKLVVILVFALILVLIGAIVLVALFANPENTQLQTFSTGMTTLLTASVGAILGLIGGKAVV